MKVTRIGVAKSGKSSAITPRGKLYTLKRLLVECDTLIVEDKTRVRTDEAIDGILNLANIMKSVVPDTLEDTKVEIFRPERLGIDVDFSDESGWYIDGPIPEIILVPRKGELERVTARDKKGSARDRLGAKNGIDLFFSVPSLPLKKVGRAPSSESTSRSIEEQVSAAPHSTSQHITRANSYKIGQITAREKEIGDRVMQQRPLVHLVIISDFYVGVQFKREMFPYLEILDVSECVDFGKGIYDMASRFAVPTINGVKLKNSSIEVKLAAKSTMAQDQQEALWRKNKTQFEQSSKKPKKPLITEGSRRPKVGSRRRLYDLEEEIET